MISFQLFLEVDRMPQWARALERVRQPLGSDTRIGSGAAIETNGDIYRIAFRSRWCGLILSLIARSLFAAGDVNSSDVLAQQSRQQPFCFPSDFPRQQTPRRTLLGWMKQFELSDSLSG